MSDWTADAEAAINLCKNWAAGITTNPGSIYLFGSVIYKGGEQFDSQVSDLDIVVRFANSADPAVERAQQLEAIRVKKHSLELEIVGTLHRTNCVEPAVSIVPVTDLDLVANIHKSGVRHFFDKNFYYDLISHRIEPGLTGTASQSLPDENRNALEYVQRTRNEFLSICANGTGGLAPYAGIDPIPKALARAAAQLVPNPAEGEWYDTRHGLELVWDSLSRRRVENDLFGKLFDCISVRRGGRGIRRDITAFQQLLLAELLFDIAANVTLLPNIVWEIQLSGRAHSASELARILTALKRLVPDADLVAIRYGSVILRVRSSSESFETLKQIDQLGVLAHFFNVDEAKLTVIDDQQGKVSEGFPSADPIDALVQQISMWRPRSVESMRAIETHLASWLADFLVKLPMFSGAKFARDVRIESGLHVREVDFLLTYPTPSGLSTVIVELVRLRSQSAFFQQVERLLQLGQNAVLVVVGLAEQLQRLQPDIDKFALHSAAVRIVPVAFDNG